ncbi:hypothetical protein [Actinomarinicola tropica]|uniref:Uncharacterized protein n=1 Tax=Actinomarinicola tropica TaxID=2789776 RepID=A0A5Q2RLX4_9ACTN|nr:hypothetical protein [Actinomarinicola tropica]QGG95932.1 hypothetical protein GH723_12955 [Actinomarinicola tropica]
MHPIERLRYVARASGAGHDVLVRETASALATFIDDPAGMVTACRRVVARQPTSGPIWWLTSRVLTAPDPMREAWDAVEEFENDTTVRELAHAIEPDLTVTVLGWPELVASALVRRGDLAALVVDVLGEGSGLVRRLTFADDDAEAVDVPVAGLGAAVAESDLVLLEASAIGPEAFLSIAGSRAAAATARSCGVPVWLVGGAGRLMPARVWEGLVARLDVDEPWDADDEVVPLDLVDRIVGAHGPEPVADALRRTDCPVAPELFKEL